MYELALFQLRKNLDVLLDLIKNVDEEQRNWRSSEKEFSIHEILCHFYEMELNYYRPQMEWLLLNPEKALPTIETQNWRYTKMYNSRDFRVTLRRFVIEREASVRWLQSINEEKWETTFTDTKSRKISAKLFLMNWLNNDYLEFQKIVKMKFEFINNVQEPTLKPLRYAGDL
jgi:hypothetical protein